MISLTPKGLIFHSFGGYGTPESEEKTDICIKALSEYLNKHNVAIISDNQGIKFVDIKQKKWWML